MTLTKPKKSENTIDTAISLLDAADYCGHVSVLLDQVILLIKDEYQPTRGRRKIINHLLTLTKALPIIANTVKNRATKCAPSNSNAAYARRLLVASNQTDNTSEIKLQMLVDKSNSDKAKVTTPLRTTTTRSKKTVTISPQKDQFLQAQAPVPKNKSKFLVDEACLAFYNYPNRSQKIQLVEFWYLQGWVPCKGINWWHKNSKAVKDGKSNREWLVDKNGDWLEDGKIKTG